MKTIDSRFFRFPQNNSGGSFIRSKGYEIWIEAFSAEEANEIAESQGIYFNGVETGDDCECCGDRWFRVSDSDGEKHPVLNAHAKGWGLDCLLIPYKKDMRTLSVEDCTAEEK